MPSLSVVRPLDWRQKELACARELNFELPENLPLAVEMLENAVRKLTETRKTVILLFDEVSGVYACLADEKTPDAKPRELTRISDGFLQALLQADDVIHSYLLLANNLVGIVAVADKLDGEPFTEQDELVLELMAPYLATKVSAFKTLKQSLVLPYIQGVVLGTAGRLVTAVDRESIMRETLTVFSRELGFDAGQYVAVNAENGQAEVLYESLQGQVESYAHAGLEGKRKKVQEFSSLVTLLTSIARKGPYLRLNSGMLGDKPLSEIFAIPGIQSGLILPVFDLATGSIRGTFNLFRTKPGHLSNEALTIAREISAMVSQALSRANVLEKALAMASCDELTGLTNRRGFYERFESELERGRRQNAPLCVALIDVDHFKRFNDTYGHLSGDCVLKGLADLFTQSVRKSDVVCRFGGEEFAILLPDTGLQAATDLLERVRRNVETMTITGVHGEPLKVTISGGVVQAQVGPVQMTGSDKQARSDRHLISDALEQADVLLYQAKEQGRNRICAASR